MTYGARPQMKQSPRLPMLELLTESINCKDKIACRVVCTQRMIPPVILPGCLRQPTRIDESQHLS
jgi:hypothetical protein